MGLTRGGERRGEKRAGPAVARSRSRPLRGFRLTRKGGTLHRRCQHCHESVAEDAVAGEGQEEAGDEGLLLGESWMDLTAPPAGASNRGDAVDRRCHKTTHELVEEHSKVCPSDHAHLSESPSSRSPTPCLLSHPLGNSSPPPPHTHPPTHQPTFPGDDQVMEIVGQDGSTGQSLAYPLCESCTLRVLKVQPPHAPIPSHPPPPPISYPPPPTENAPLPQHLCLSRAITQPLRGASIQLSNRLANVGACQCAGPCEGGVRAVREGAAGAGRRGGWR